MGYRGGGEGDATRLKLIVATLFTRPKDAFISNCAVRWMKP